ncbi:hypothetical protein [Roseovarius sp. MMSF_3305]|uniref:hypothetical protein n=1 Tax=Roseovarius sp. MMSF_3305 TaxID=3046697 RepID=UPI0027401902|nr:hypothetical protein [Roseovarius sp. MMSF_3305]
MLKAGGCRSWTTKGSRTRDELGGNDDHMTEGFLLADEGVPNRPDTVVYDADTQITGVSGSMVDDRRYCR